MYFSKICPGNVHCFAIQSTQALLCIDVYVGTPYNVIDYSIIQKLVYTIDESNKFQRKNIPPLFLKTKKMPLKNLNFVKYNLFV